MGDGLQIDLLGFDRATIDEAANASTIILIAPDLKEELPVLYLRLRDAAPKSGAAESSSSPRSAAASRSTLEDDRVPAGNVTRPLRRRWPTRRSPTQIGQGNVVVVAGRANLAERPPEVGNGVVAACCSSRRGEGVAGDAPWQRRRRDRDGSGPRCRWRECDASGIAKAAAAGNIEMLVLLGCDPLADFPDTDLAGRMIAGVPRIIAIDTFLNEVERPRGCRARGSGVRREERHHDQHRRPRHDTFREGHPRGTSRPDWMIAVELADLLGGDLGVSRSTTSPTRSPPTSPGSPATVAALRGARDGIVCQRLIDLRPPLTVDDEERNSYDYRLVVGRKLYDNARRYREVAIAGAPRPGSQLHLTPAGRRARRVNRRCRCQGHQQARHRWCSRSSPTTSRCVVSAWVPFNQPGPSIGELIDSNEVVTDVRVESF